ncbi:MAG: helix-turn-helix transcriptional regulator [Actinomycetota bacterium]
MPVVVQGFIWPTEMLMIASGLLAEAHTHSAVQVMVGIDAPIRVQMDGVWSEVPGVVIAPDADHGFDGTGGTFAGGWVEAESRLGAALMAVVDAGHEGSWIALDPSTASAAGERLLRCRQPGTNCAQARREWRAALGIITADDDGEHPEPDARLAAVFEHLRAVPSPPPSVDELCAAAHLSESRLQHLFRDQVGVPIRRYLLWHRLLTALGELTGGASVTAAAHAAGFADGPHFTRVAKRMTGIAPSELQAMAPVFANCRDTV